MRKDLNYFSIMEIIVISVLLFCFVFCLGILGVSWFYLLVTKAVVVDAFKPITLFLILFSCCSLAGVFVLLVLKWVYIFKYTQIEKESEKAVQIEKAIDSSLTAFLDASSAEK